MESVGQAQGMGPEGHFSARVARRWLALIVLPLGLAACAESRLISHTTKQVTREPQQTAAAPARKQGVYKVGNPYQVAGVWYYPKEDPNYDETGIASWYGPDFHGKSTANGEIFDMNEVTAAHQTLPLPSLVRVTNLENGRSIIVRVNDRGPFVNGRIIDLSRRSAQLLGTDRQGVARVRVQMVGPASGDPNVAQPVAPSAPEDRQPVEAAPRATVVAEALPAPQGARQAPPPRNAAPPPRMPAAPAASSTAAAASANQQARTELAPVQLQQQPIRQVAVKPTGIFVQAGAFTQFDNANRLSARLAGLGPTRVSSAIVNGTEFFRVRVGPLNDVAQADQMLAYLIANGSPDARILVE
jgi:rare lipoprotein A